MRVMIIRKDKTFLTMKLNWTVKRSSGTQKVKIDIGFLGCVEHSTYGNLLGESRIFVPTSGSADAKDG
jgi:hypothetical protein